MGKGVQYPTFHRAHRAVAGEMADSKVNTLQYRIRQIEWSDRQGNEAGRGVQGGPGVGMPIYVVGQEELTWKDLLSTELEGIRLWGGEGCT